MFKARSAFIAVCALCGVFASLPLSASADQTLQFPPSTDVQSTECSWGAHPIATTYGQTVTVPAGETKLDSFSFHVINVDDPSTNLPSFTPVNIVYKAYVYAWDGQKAVDPVLWQSGAQTLTAGGTPSEVTAAIPGGVTVTPGAQYVMFFSTAETFSSNTPGAVVCFMNGPTTNPYPGGAWQFLNNGTDTSQWTSVSWPPTGSDLAFTAAFSTPVADGDGDGVPDDSDNCPTVSNADQLDQDGDGVGNACDPDQDGDDVDDGDDNCALTPNADQRDTDADNLGDECDPFPGSTAGCRVTLGGDITVDGERATFGGNAQAKTLEEAAGELEYTDHGNANPTSFKSLTVDSAICSEHDVTIRGAGRADGEAVTYRIDVHDNAEPGSADTYRIQLSNGYDSGDRTLNAGNVQVRVK